MGLIWNKFQILMVVREEIFGFDYLREDEK